MKPRHWPVLLVCAAVVACGQVWAVHSYLKDVDAAWFVAGLGVIPVDIAFVAFVLHWIGKMYSHWHNQHEAAINEAASRAPDLAALDAWLADPTCPYELIRVIGPGSRSSLVPKANHNAS